MGWNTLSHSAESLDGLFVGGGILMSNLGKTTADASGSSARVGSTNLNLLLMMNYGFISPFFNLTPFGRETGDDAATVRYYSLGVPLRLPLGDVDVRLGPGIFFQHVSGTGGTIERENGSSTRAFARPDRSSLSNSLFFSLGFSVYLNREWRVDIDGMVNGVGSKLKRNYFGLIQVSYGAWFI